MRADKAAERRRYDQRAAKLRADAPSRRARPAGSAAIAPIYRAPYLCYERHIERLVRAGHRVLEIGAGTGLHTAVLVRAGARVVATDISGGSLRLLAESYAGAACAVQADIESLPFRDASFDVVACAGSLSYGRAAAVDAEIRRVLKRGGTFLCVDALNDNPVYRFYRWLGAVRGQRTRETWRRLATEARVREIARAFDRSSVDYFGAATMLMPLCARLVGQRAAARLSDAVDGLLGTRRAAFKFVLAAERRL